MNMLEQQKLDERSVQVYGVRADQVERIRESFLDDRPDDADRLMELMSRLSDVQELVAREYMESARTDINIVKMLLGEMHRKAVCAREARYAAESAG